MFQFEFDFDPKSTYLLACSFGPDSMALFHMLINRGIKPIACFVNYHKRDVSNQEQIDFTKFCKEHNIPFEILDTEGMSQVGNFQSWAREVRYDFFKKMYDKYHASGIFVAHHQDDLLETYIIQKMRKARVKEYGISKLSVVKDMVVIRPLLNYSKQDLLEYCNENLVPYSIDMSNFETKYLRNQIRIEVIGRLSEIDRANLLKEIDDMNNKRNEIIEDIPYDITLGKELDIREIIALDKETFRETLIKFVSRAPIHIDLSEGRISEIRKMCLAQEPNISMKLANDIYLVKEYDVIVLVVCNECEQNPYEYVMEEPTKLSTPEFDVDFTNETYLDRKIKFSDFPLTIRSPKQGDRMVIGHHNCELRRLFIDWKMPARLRKVWPVFVNKDGIIVYVPRYRKTFVDNHVSKLNIKVTNK